MHFISFPQANKVFTKPEGWKDGECFDLHAFVGVTNITDEMDNDEITGIAPCITIAVMPSKEDIEAILAGKPIWFSLMSPVMVPVSCGTENPFE